jgi:hypothetical protein
MENTQDIDNAALPLEEPHFVDEMTVVTALPVVSLDAITEERRHRRRWFLAGAFALALLLGAGTALLAISIKRHMAESTAVQAEVSEEEAPPVGEATPMQGGETSAPVVDTAENPVVAQEQSRPKKEPQRALTKSPVAKKPVVKEEEPKAVLVDQWEESRTRRVWKRERRERRQRQEAFRIGEIFEGRRRSGRPD